MIEPASVTEILKTYKKHGWKLERVLLSPESRKELGDAEEIFRGAEICGSETDAAWFSRRSRPDVVAWELRRFGGTPFAIFRNVPDGTGPDEVEAILNDAESDLNKAGIRSAPESLN